MLADVFQRYSIIARAQYPYLRVICFIDREADSGPRSFAFCTEDDNGEGYEIHVAPKLLFSSVHRMQGIIAHEIGHAILLHVGVDEHTERDADRMAEQVFDVKIAYDSEDVQTTAYGVRPRPSYLDDEDGRTCVE